MFIDSDIDTLKDKLGTVRPHFFITVPRLLEKVYEGIVNKGLALTGIKRNYSFGHWKWQINTITTKSHLSCSKLQIN